MAHIRIRIVNGKTVKETLPAPTPGPPPNPKSKASDWRTSEATAKDLRKAAKLLESRGYPSFEFGHIYLLLAGLSLENLVKAVLTKKGLQKWTNDKLSWGCNGHNLPGLFRNASIRRRLSVRDWLGGIVGRLRTLWSLKNRLEALKQTIKLFWIASAHGVLVHFCGVFLGIWYRVSPDPFDKPL
jgi:hypothetical protein